VLEAHKQLLGPEHPNTLQAMGNLACTLQKLGNYAEAQELEVKVLEAMANLACTFHQSGNYTQAPELGV
jgi:hypothetical protein